ncbi:MAG: lysophospholipid acyltransferase family protein, partial [Gammaproteobacteria bacterium]
MARFILGHGLRRLGDTHGVVEGLLYRIDHAFFTLLLWLMRRLGPQSASRLGARIGAALGPRFKKSVALDENLRIAFPAASVPDRERIARECWANAGAVLAEYAHIDTLGDLARGFVEARVLGDIAAFRDNSRPALFCTMHQANWELAGAAIVGLGAPLTVVYSPPTNPMLDELLARWRSRIGAEMLARDESMRPMIRALAAGRSLGIVMDRRVDSGRAVPFCGHPKPTTLIPARLAIRFGYQLVPLRVERTGPATIRATFHEPLAVPPGDDEVERATE